MWTSNGHIARQQTMRLFNSLFYFSFSSTSCSSSSSSRIFSYSLSYLINKHYISHQRRLRAMSNSNYYSQDGEDKVEQMRECCGKEACEFTPKGERVSDSIIPHILNLYASSATPHDFDIYAAHASFEDPLMCANGVKQIKSAFYSIQKIFSESRIVEFSLKENSLSPGRHEILLDSKQYYKFLGKDINMISLIRLYVEDGKVVRHEDLWDRKPLRDRHTVHFPMVGRLAEVMRRGSMLATHAMMGFGKDPVA